MPTKLGHDTKPPSGDQKPAAVLVPTETAVISLLANGEGRQLWRTQGQIYDNMMLVPGKPSTA